MMMSLWTIFRSPLFYGGDFTGCGKEDLELLTNEEVLRIHDTLEHSAQIYRDGVMAVWRGESDSYIYYGIFNLSLEEIQVDIRKLRGEGQEFLDMWNRRKAQELLVVPSHDATLIRVM